MACKSSIMHLLRTLFGSYSYTVLDSRTRIEEGV